MHVSITPTRAVSSAWILGTALLVTLAVYWAGLSGPYLLDDLPILGPVDRWNAGEQRWQITLIPNSESFVDSRPVAMASFMLSSWLGGHGTLPLKLGNLLVHLLCGLTGWWLLRRIFTLDAKLASRAGVYAAIAAALWLLHPLQVSTVLYAVQRMAQLAALFTLAAISIYLVARQQLADGRLLPAVSNLFLSFPLLLTLGVLSKQNAVIAPMLCLVLELLYFQRISVKDRGILAGFFGMFVAVPVAAVLALLIFAPKHLLAGYAEFDFTPWQRLLTQTRVLLDYIGMWFAPRGPEMGLYTDAYAVSTSLLSPPGTLVSITLLAAATGFAVAFRKRAKSVLSGWLFFFVAHGVESTVLPLDLYFEHRNYLPAFGLLTASVGMLALVPDRFRASQLLPRFKIIATAAILAALAFATLSRVLVWQHEELIIAQGFEQHPRSLAARLDLMSLSFRAENYVRARELNSPLLQSDDPRERVVGNLLAITIACLDGSELDRNYLQDAIAHAQPKLTHAETRAVRTLSNLAAQQTCDAVDNEKLGDTVSRLAAKASDQTDDIAAKYLTRASASKLYARAAQWDKAEIQARLAWDGSQHLPYAALLARIYLQSGKLEEAQSLIEVLEARVDPNDNLGQAEITNLKFMSALGTGAAGLDVPE